MGYTIKKEHSRGPFSLEQNNIYDGHLLTNAPELLQALKLAKAHSELPDEILDIVDDAIAKAEGRMFHGMRIVIDETLPPDAFRIVERDS